MGLSGRNQCLIPPFTHRFWKSSTALEVYCQTVFNHLKSPFRYANTDTVTFPNIPHSSHLKTLCPALCLPSRFRNSLALSSASSAKCPPTTGRLIKVGPGNPPLPPVSYKSVKGRSTGSVAQEGRRYRLRFHLSTSLTDRSRDDAS